MPTSEPARLLILTLSLLIGLGVVWCMIGIAP